MQVKEGMTPNADATPAEQPVRVDPDKPGLEIGLASFLVLALATMGIGLILVGQKQPRAETDLTAMPDTVQSALDRAELLYERPLTGAEWSTAYQLRESERSLYQVIGMNRRGHRIEIEIAGAGRIIEAEEHGIPIAEVPGAVMLFLRERMPELKPTKADAIYNNGKSEPAAYGFEGAGADGKKIQIFISADGTAVLN